MLLTMKVKVSPRMMKINNLTLLKNYFWWVFRYENYFFNQPKINFKLLRYLVWDSA